MSSVALFAGHSSIVFHRAQAEIASQPFRTHTGGKPICELSTAGSDPTANPRLIFGDVNFLTIRDALKDISGLIQFTFNLHSSVYTIAICKHALVHVYVM